MSIVCFQNSLNINEEIVKEALFCFKGRQMGVFVFVLFLFLFCFVLFCFCFVLFGFFLFICFFFCHRS